MTDRTRPPPQPPDPDEFWELLARSGLVDAATARSLWAEHDALPEAERGRGVRAAALWLVERGVLTPWQARRLRVGDLGPFFIGDYRLLERHEREGDGLLFTGRHEPSGRDVSLMLLNAKRCRQLDVWTEIVRRTTAAHRAQDPLLSRTWALERHEASRFIVCELVRGESLAEELERTGPWPLARAGRLAWRVARAVAELHALDTVHGDLSLDVLRREAGADPAADGRVRLLQFPLSGDPHRVPLQPPPIDDAEQVAPLGRRAAFIAPELTVSGAVCDARSDVYAIGCILYALLAGRLPCWQGDAAATLRQAALAGPAPLGPGLVEPEVTALLGFLMARDPNGRYGTAGEAAAAIAECLGCDAADLPTAVVAAAPVAPAAVAVTAAVPPFGVAPQPVAADELPSFTAPAAPAAAPAAAMPEVSVRDARSTPPPPAPRPVPAAPRDGSGPGATGPATPVAPGVLAARRRAARLRLIGGVLTAVLVLVAAGVVVSRLDFGRPGTRVPRPVPQKPRPLPPAAPRPAPDAEIAVAAPEPVAAPPPSATARQIVVEDDSLPWASPTEGPPPVLEYLPPGSQLVLLARLSAILADDEGRLFVRALGPVAEGALSEVARVCGCALEDVELVQAGWQAHGADAIIGGFTFRLRAGRTAPATDEARLQAWGPITELEVAGETVHRGGGLGYWVPTADRGRVLVVVPDVPLAAAPALPGEPAEEQETLLVETVRRGVAARRSGAGRTDPAGSIEPLVGALDADRHLTLLGECHFLLDGGRPVLAGPLAKLAAPVGALFGDSLRATALSVHFADNFYVEMDAVATPDVPPVTLARELAGRVEGLADAVETYCNALVPAPYGKALVNRLPQMIRVLTTNLRAGAEGRAAVLNAYLPRHAGHNLALAAELALAENPGAPAAGPPAPAPAPPPGALGALRRKMTLTFAKDTLEKSIQDIAAEIGVPMEIVGPDLQLEGITKNQSFALDERDQPAEAILRVILAKADPAGRLVFVVRSRDGQESIDITTRAAAEKRGDTLPPGF